MERREKRGIEKEKGGREDKREHKEKANTQIKLMSRRKGRRHLMYVNKSRTTSTRLQMVFRPMLVIRYEPM